MRPKSDAAERQSALPWILQSAKAGAETAQIGRECFNRNSKGYLQLQINCIKIGFRTA
jgi:hypothetical protein